MENKEQRMKFCLKRLMRIKLANPKQKTAMVDPQLAKLLIESGLIKAGDPKHYVKNDSRDSKYVFNAKLHTCVELPALPTEVKS